MERWPRALTKNDDEFKELFGVKKEVFQQMLDVLTVAREKRRRKGRPRPRLTVGDQLLLTLQYWREYRTMAHIAYDFEIAKSTVSETITMVENVLIQDERFHLPGKKAFNRALSKERIVIENINARIKTFKIMSEKYRNRRKRHLLRMNLICAVLNQELKL